MSETALTTAENAITDISPANPLYLAKPENMAHMWEVAKTFSRSSLLPTQFRGKPEDCMVGLCLAFTLQKDLVTLFSNLHIINGKPGLSAQLTMALAEERGPFDGRIRFEEENDAEPFDNYRVRAWSTIDGERINGTWVSMKMAHLEGWTKNKKYQSMPQHMLRFRAATFMVRELAPGVLFGMQTRDELIDVRYSNAPDGTSIAELDADDKPSGQDLSAIAELNKTIQAGEDSKPAGDSGNDEGEEIVSDADEARPRSPAPSPDDAGQAEAEPEPGADDNLFDMGSN